jgi:hypothetical protein
MSKTISCLIVTAFLLFVGGCSTTGSVGFRDMSVAYREVLENYANDNVLLNIVRSSENMPLSFLDMPSVVGSGTVSGNIGLSSTIYAANPSSSFDAFFSSGAGSFYGPTAGLSVTRNFNFTQSSLDNAQFMTAFLTDIKPETVASLVNNTAGPLSLLYSLIVDYIEIRDSKQKLIEKFKNDPFEKDYNKFQQAMYYFIEAGLKTELVIVKMPLSPPLYDEEYKKHMLAISPTLSQPNVSMERMIDKSGKEYFQLYRNLMQTRLCLERTGKKSIMSHSFMDTAYCSELVPAVMFPPDKVKMPPHDMEKRHLVVKLRSTRNVFSFLGQLLNMQLSANPKVVKVKNSDLFRDNKSLVESAPAATDEFPILVIHRDVKFDKPIATVEYRGSTYSVPEENSGGSRQLLVLLAEMLSLNKVPGSIPPSPAVLVQ